MKHRCNATRVQRAFFIREHVEKSCICDGVEGSPEIAKLECVPNEKCHFQVAFLSFVLRLRNRMWRRVDCPRVMSKASEKDGVLSGTASEIKNRSPSIVPPVPRGLSPAVLAYVPRKDIIILVREVEETQRRRNSAMTEFPVG
jgi:hypothetical protein